MSERVPNVFQNTTLLEDAVTLFVGNQVYEGWEDIKLTRELNVICGDFQLQVTDKWRPDQEPWSIQPGETAHIHLGKTSILTGYVDKMEVSVNKDSRSITISGRSKTADLVDCSVTGNANYSGLNIQQLANKLVAPFGIKVVMLASPGAEFNQITVQPGETVFALLDRHARQRKLLMYPSYEGNLVFAQNGTSRAAVELRQGINVLSGSARFDHSNRFSDYTVKGQNLGFLGAEEQSIAAKGEAKDLGVTRFRPFVVMAENAADDGTSENRASYEAEIRAAKAIEVEVQVQGWLKTKGGSPWEINELVFCDVGFLGVRREMLVKKVEFNKSNSGTTTTLSLIRKDAFEFKKEKPKENPLGWVKFAD